MKKALLVLFATGWFLCGFAQEIQFEKVLHDYGQLVNYNDPGECEFVFTNTGTEPLIVQKPKTSCGCLIPSWPKDPILPGEKNVVKATYRTNRPGEINKSITITSNAINSPQIVLRVKGFVWPEGIKVSKKNDYWSFEYNNGESVSHQQFDQVELGQDRNCIRLMKNRKWGVIGRTKFIPCEFDEGFDFAGTMTVKKGGKWGCIDNDNKVVIPFEYDEKFDLDLSGWVKKRGKWGVIDKKNKVIIPFEYDGVNILSELSETNTERGIVNKGGKWGEIDMRNNTVIIPFEYEGLSPDMLTQALFAKKNGKWGVIDKSGKTIVLPFEYDEISDVIDAYYKRTK